MKRQGFKNKKLVVILHNIRSCYNVGSIFRTADALGVAEIFLGGYTPDPESNKAIVKTALGAEKAVPWQKKRRTSKLLDELKKQGFQIFALEQNEQSDNLAKFKPQFPCALVLGNEVRGLSNFFLNKVDKIVEIPMEGKKESLNVSVAFGIAAYKLLN